GKPGHGVFVTQRRERLGPVRRQRLHVDRRRADGPARVPDVARRPVLRRHQDPLGELYRPHGGAPPGGVARRTLYAAVGAIDAREGPRPRPGKTTVPRTGSCSWPWPWAPRWRTPPTRRASASAPPTAAWPTPPSRRS